MVFTKKDLKFLELYNLCVSSDATKISSSYFQIENFGNERARFLQSNSVDGITIFTDIKTTDSTKFCFYYPTRLIVQILNTCKNDNDSIEFKEGSIKLQSKSSYKFEDIQYELTSGEKEIIEEVIKSQQKSNLDIKDLKKINVVKSYTGSEPTINTVVAMKDYFISSDRRNATAAVKTLNKDIENFEFSKQIISVFGKSDLSEISINVDENKYWFRINDTYIIVKKPEEKFKTIIPNIFSDEFKGFYNFETTVVIDRELFLDSLNRVNIFARENLDSRIFVNFKSNSLVIESRDKGRLATEEIEAKVDSNLVGLEILLSNNYLIGSISNMETKNIILKISTDVTAPAISVWPDNGDDIFIIVNKCKNIA